MNTFRLSSTTNQSVMWSSLLTEVCTDKLVSASVYHWHQRFVKESSSKFYVQPKESDCTWMILHLKVQTWTIIFVYSDSFFKLCVKQKFNSSVRNVFIQPSIKYLGNILCSAGLWPDSEKDEAVVKAPPLTNLNQLKSFLWLVQYYASHVPYLSSLADFLNELRNKEVRFK